MLMQRLDVYVMSWATFGCFFRLLDSGKITNTYVSWTKEGLNFDGNQCNLLTTFSHVGTWSAISRLNFSLLGSALQSTSLTVKLLLVISTFCFEGVPNVKTVFALRFILGMLESPFAVGVLTLMGSWYTPRELFKRFAIFYSAS
ncbi:uncharacterized protein CC84DRAFT_114446 [Paraphaeosphaeria sporulosa]|uniref:Major facilitator superfamily (MFS) profile domain-containing protein n=1 Tax=Paraphaeosphaeria sporulosa TaxID=1460663 RepID=A0A177CXU0_9PLEO|nr:uncharacterized protein CC84DRAFT_114446 [Paraphaeosphaeria sporulosa]OAG12384.1 hypothetical protein CC84DRAFT_114446 [Paraphaeosphaeria sporulosa]